MGLFDSTAEPPHSKALRYVITVVVFIALLILAAWWVRRFHTEKETAVRFLDTLVAGQTEEAYRLWKPSASYSYSDFLDDWGPNGYYGPVRSFRIESATLPKNGSAVSVTVLVSPDRPFPDDNDAAKQSKVKEVSIWVNQSDQSLSFPPPAR